MSKAILTLAILIASVLWWAENYERRIIESPSADRGEQAINDTKSKEVDAILAEPFTKYLATGIKIQKIKDGEQYTVDGAKKSCITDADGDYSISDRTMRICLVGYLPKWQVIYHEIGHDVYYHRMTIDQRVEWVALSGSDSFKDYVSNYARKDVGEDFAETFAEVLADKRIDDTFGGSELLKRKKEFVRLIIIRLKHQMNGMPTM